MTKGEKQVLSSILTGNPDAAGNDRVFIDGSTRCHAVLRTAAIGFGTYEPGWRWSVHAGPQTGRDSANHIGYVISGRMMVKDPSGNEVEIGPGWAFEVGPGHDAWVVGEAPCIALDFMPISG
jgi:hypothetical protein